VGLVDPKEVATTQLFFSVSQGGAERRATEYTASTSAIGPKPLKGFVDTHPEVAAAEGLNNICKKLSTVLPVDMPMEGTR
jgi:hypothetical protein